MNSNQEFNPDIFHRKARLAGRIAIVSCFLLAIFWPLGSFFGWIFSGAAVYFGFLTWFYRNQAEPKEPTRGGEARDVSVTAETSKKIRINILIPIVVGLFIFGAIARSIISSSTAAEETSVDVSGKEDVEKVAPEEGKSDDIDVLTNRGNKFYDEGKYDSALFYYNRVLTIGPTNQFAQYDKALVYYAQKDYGRSVPILIRCLRQHPDYGEAFWLLGDNYYDRHNLDSAKICFDRAYEKGIRHGGFLQLMASFYEVNDRSKAIALYKQSIEQDSTLLDSYRKLISLDPSQSGAYQRMMSKWVK